MKSRRQGFTLIELLIVIAIIGILAAIAIPNLLNAVQRAKQKRTMADMRALATAIEAYDIDNSEYPPADCLYAYYASVGTALTDTSFANLSPTYISNPPLRDGWSNYLLYYLDNGNFVYTLRSVGRDGSLGTVNCGTTTNFNDDIVFAAGTFVQWPEGAQN